MTKVLKLNVTYWGNYGGDVDETMILPFDINGVVFYEVEEGTHRDAIGLGEIEGKHSDVDGDLVVSVVDLDELTLKEVSDLIGISDFGQFEGFFESQEYDFEEDEDYKKDKVDEICEYYEVDETSYMSKTSQIHDKFIEQLKEKYVKSFRDVTVLEEDYDRVIKLLAAQDIKVFI